MPSPDSLDLPETWRYRLKDTLLGPPLASERQSVERLGKPAALAILSSDVISSSAYATEELLVPLVPIVGVAAFSLVVPITLVVLVALIFVTLSYLEVVKVYTRSGGAYVVARENFGPRTAQVAAVSLLIDYTLTVAVSVAAGVAAITSVFPTLVPDTLWLSIAFVVLLAYGNLRGVREAGRIFAVPTYFFIVNMVALLCVGTVKAILGDLHPHSIHQAGAIAIGSPGSGLLMGAGVLVVMRSFASGGVALTGTEAISNGVSIFRPPESRNARITLAVVAVILGTLVLGTAAFAAMTHPVPYESGSPTVVAQLAQYIYGSGPLPHIMFVLLQAGTMFILVLAANTSFTGFPLLASFAAEDSYLPRQLTRRGHRLVFSTGIIILAGTSVALLIVTNARVNSLIPLYAIGVFTGFTMAGAGMFRYHLREREAHWRRGAIINGSAAIVSMVVLVIIAVSKFTEGAWFVLILLPVGVVALLLLHRQYVTEDEQLEEGASQACEAPVLRRHVVLVFVDRLDQAVARGLQYGRTLSPDELRAVHFAIDSRDAEELEADWSRLGLSELPLDIIHTPDRRLARAALKLAAQTVQDGSTELTVLLPRRGYASGWRRLLHDGSADRIAETVGQLPHANATIVPFHLSRRTRVVRHRSNAGYRAERAPHDAKRAPRDPMWFGDAKGSIVAGAIPIADAQWRTVVSVAGRVQSVRVPSGAASPVLMCTLTDDTGAILLVFNGRRRVPGIQQGTLLTAHGTVTVWKRQRAILNPSYEILVATDSVL
jgi:amino acid transporter